MNTNVFKWLLRVWIALVSAAAFVMGWLFLGRSTTSASAVVDSAFDSGTYPQLAPLPTLAPLPSYNGVGTTRSSMQPFSQGSNQQFGQPMFRSRGS